MRIEEFNDNPLNAYIKAERYINDGSPSGFSSKNTTSWSTSPRSFSATFNVKELLFDNSIKIINIGETNQYAFHSNAIIIHPDMIAHPIIQYNPFSFGRDIIVSPTASGRTVVTISDNPFFIKLAYPKCLGRLVRHMGKDKIISACEVTNHLMRAIKNNQISKRFSFLREDCGQIALLNIDRKGQELYPVNKNGMYEWGVIYRDYKPFPYIDLQEYLIPFFALFGNEYVPGLNQLAIFQDEPLIIQLFKHQNDYCGFVDFLLNEIVYPLLDVYFQSLLYGGIELEAHAQNILLSIDSSLKIRRIVCRDLESAGRDATLMDYLGIPYEKKCDYKYNELKAVEKNQKYPKWVITHSFMFDFKLGEYILSPLITKCKEFYEFDVELLNQRIRNYNRQYISQLPDVFFPLDWCDYDKINFEQEKTERIYRWHEKPKYR